MKRLIAGVVTIGLMGLLLWSGMRRPAPGATDGSVESAPGRSESHPAESRIQTLLESARQGDLSGYLDSFSGPLRQRLEREAAERGRDAFAADLRRAAAACKSHAVFAVEPDGDAAARVVVESIYADRNEKQTFRLEARDGGWLVSEVDSVKSHQPRAKYGAPASFVAPEGVPVQAEGVVVETGDEPRAGSRPDE